MSWLKLTEKSLYLMEGGQYLKKVDLRAYNNDQALDIPFEWFKGMRENLPLVVAINTDTADAEPFPMPKPTIESSNFLGQDLASRILRYMDSKKYKIFEGSREYNIVYVEGMNVDGNLNRDTANVFNDIRLVIEVVSGQPKIVGGPWAATTEPSTHYTLNAMNPGGAARIRFDQYTAWQVGIHNGNHEALIQTGGEVSVCRDFDRNGIRNGDKIDTGYFGINQHHGYDNPIDNIGKAGAGCLVGRSSSEHKQFMQVIKQDRRYLQDKAFIFTATVIPGDQLS
jgi:hypothetical protein